MKKMGTYDVIVVGARAAGAATAMLLARRGLNVLAVDRAAYGSDTLSTHALMRTGVMQLHRWGLLDAVRQARTPAIGQVTFRYPDETVSVPIKPADGIDALYAPRRIVLDAILADAAWEAGATLRFGVTVDALEKERGRVAGIRGHVDGTTFTAHAPMVIGADGIRSIVARESGAPIVREARSEGAVVYGYFRNVDATGYEWGYGPQISAGIIPTNDGEACVFVGGSTLRFGNELRPDLRSGFYRMLRAVSPAMADRVGAGQESSRFRGFAGVRGYYRRAFGDGWALVGDAGYFRDPITTHGLSDAFRDAELLARAIAGPSSMAEYEEIRDAVTRDLFEVTDRIASYAWTIDEVRKHLRDVSRAMKAEMDVIASFDAEESVKRTA